MGKSEVASDFKDAIASWMQLQEEKLQAGGRQDPVKELYEELQGQGCTFSYKAVVRYIRRRQSAPMARPKRRVEVLPGSQGQIDWTEHELNIADLGGPVSLQAFCMTLSFSRMWAVVWAVNQRMLNWIECHNGAFERVEGIPTTMRHDNLRTAVASGSGPWSLHNQGYLSYAKQMGFLPDACLPYRGDHKGKVERRNRDLKWLQIGRGEAFQSLADLQEQTDYRGLERSKKLLCPLTGKSVYESWIREREHLRPLPATLPSAFDTQVTRSVAADCLVNFEGRQYQVPNEFVRCEVQIRGCATTVEIYSGNTRLCVYPRGTECRILLDQTLYDAKSLDGAPTALPLGRVGREIVLPKTWEWQTPERSIDVYDRLLRGLA